MSFDLYHDEYEYLAARFQLNTDEDNPPRGGKPRKKGKQPYQSNRAASLADAQPKLEDAFHTTYRPARYEEVFLNESLQPFVTQTLIDDVLALVKGGKEANVYLCQAASHLDVELIAAKVYRPRQFRNLRNDMTYREGRELVNSRASRSRTRTTVRCARLARRPRSAPS